MLALHELRRILGAMRARALPLLLLLSVLVTVTILRETGIITLNSWNSSFRIDGNLKWKETTTTYNSAKFDLSQFHPEIEVLPYANNGNARKVATILENYQSPMDGPWPAKLKISIQMRHHGTPWMPLNKHGVCHVVANFRLKADATDMTCDLSATYEGNATFDITGICATRTFYEQFNEEVGNELVKQLDQWIRDKLGPGAEGK